MREIIKKAIMKDRSSESNNVLNITHLNPLKNELTTKLLIDVRYLQ